MAAPEDRATELSIGDGDTIRMQQGQQRLTVRLARSYLQSRLQVGSTVTLQPQTIDRYGRTVAEVIGEINLGLAMVEDGQAFVYWKHLGQCDAREYLDAEFRASRRRYGVWQVPGGITRPWVFRRGRTSVRSGGDTGSVPGGRQECCNEIGSTKQAKYLLLQGPIDLGSNGDREDCENVPGRDGDPHLPALASISRNVSFRPSMPYTHGPHRF